MRPDVVLNMSKNYVVSIHAPVKDATQIQFLAKMDKSFNPRTRKGCDSTNFNLFYFSYCFNPRTRKGCDPIAVLCLTELSGFNPRTRKGCDSMFMESFIDNIFSI